MGIDKKYIHKILIPMSITYMVFKKEYKKQYDNINVQKLSYNRSHQGLSSISGWMFYSKISWSLESREIENKNDRIALKYDRSLGNTPAEAPVKFQYQTLEYIYMYFKLIVQDRVLQYMYFISDHLIATSIWYVVSTWQQKIIHIAMTDTKMIHIWTLIKF